MPVLAFLVVAGLTLLALLFVADATLEKSSPPIVTSSRVGLPKRWHSDAIQVLTTTPAPTLDMTSQAVLAAQPKSDREAFANIAPSARAARGEATPEDKRVTQPIGYRQTPLFDRFSIKGY
jgi:hypothetical protein